MLFFYAVAPAFGPFIFDPSPSSDARLIQEAMLEFHLDFINSHGACYDPSYFVAGVAAMPSLHVANSVVFCLCAERDARWLLILYLPITFYIFLEAVVLRWHYMIDLAFGALIGWICFRLANWIVIFSYNNKSMCYSNTYHKVAE